MKVMKVLLISFLFCATTVFAHLTYDLTLEKGRLSIKVQNMGLSTEALDREFSGMQKRFTFYFRQPHCVDTINKLHSESEKLVIQLKPPYGFTKLEKSLYYDLNKKIVYADRLTLTVKGIEENKIRWHLLWKNSHYGVWDEQGLEDMTMQEVLTHIANYSQRFSIPSDNPHPDGADFVILHNTDGQQNACLYLVPVNHTSRWTEEAIIPQGLHVTYGRYEIQVKNRRGKTVTIVPKPPTETYNKLHWSYQLASKEKTYKGGLSGLFNAIASNSE